MRNRRTSASATSAGSSRAGRRPASRSRVGQARRRAGPGLVEVAGREVRRHRPRSRAPASARSSSVLPGELVDADRDVQGTVSWARAACGVPVGRYMLSPGSSSTSRDSPRSPGRRAPPTACEPWVWKTNTSWLSLCTAKPCEPGGRQVGVGLAGVAERELELGDEARQRRPVAVQPLEHDGRAALEQVDHLARVDQPGQRLAGQAWRRCGCSARPAAPTRPGRAARPGCGSPSRSAAGRRRRTRAARPARRGRPGGGGRGTPRPSRRRSGRPRSAARGRPLRRRCRRCRPRRCRRSASPSPSVGVAVGAVGVVVPSVPSASSPSVPSASVPGVGSGVDSDPSAVTMSPSCRGSWGVVMAPPSRAGTLRRVATVPPGVCGQTSRRSAVTASCARCGRARCR